MRSLPMVLFGPCPGYSRNSSPRGKIFCATTSFLSIFLYLVDVSGYNQTLGAILMLVRIFNSLAMFIRIGINGDLLILMKAMGVSERSYLKKNTTDLCRGQIYAV